MDSFQITSDSKAQLQAFIRFAWSLGYINAGFGYDSRWIEFFENISYIQFSTLYRERFSESYKLPDDWEKAINHLKYFCNKYKTREETEQAYWEGIRQKLIEESGLKEGDIVARNTESNLASTIIIKEIALVRTPKEADQFSYACVLRYKRKKGPFLVVSDWSLSFPAEEAMLVNPVELHITTKDGNSFSPLIKEDVVKIGCKRFSAKQVRDIRWLQEFCIENGMIITIDNNGDIVDLQVAGEQIANPISIDDTDKIVEGFKYKKR